MSNRGRMNTYLNIVTDVVARQFRESAPTEAETGLENELGLRLLIIFHIRD